MPNDNAHGDGSDNSQGSEPSTTPKYMTAEDFNKAASARFGAFEKSFDKKFKESLGEVVNNVASMVDKLLAEKLGDATVGAPKKEKSSDDDPVVRGLKKQVEEMQRALSETKSVADAEKARARDISLRQKLADELGKHGMSGPQARHAIGFLVDAEKRVSWGEDNEIVFKDSDGLDIDLASGVKTWAGSDEAKIYMPPRGTVGSGERPSGSGKLVNGKGQLDRAALNAALFKAVTGG